MDQKYNKKDRHVLTIIAGILCGLHLSAFIAYLIFIFILRVEISPQLLLGIILIGILGIVFAIIANKEKQGKLRIVFILINAFLLMPGSLVYLFGDLALSSSHRNEQLDREIREKATIEYIQNAIPEKRLPLQNLESFSSGFAYYDYDGEVAKYFKSMTFNYYSDFNEDGSSFPIQFYFGRNVKALFNGDFSIIFIHADNSGFLKGYHEAKNTYYTSSEQAIKLKSLVDTAINEQMTACKAKEAEIKTETSLENALEYMNNSNYDFQCTLKRFSNELGTAIDKDKEIYNILKTIDSSSLEEYTKYVSTYNEQGVKYFLNEDNKYYLFYHSYDKYLEVNRNYQDPYGNDYVFSLRYVYEGEDAQQIVEIAIRLNNYEGPYLK